MRHYLIIIFLAISTLAIAQTRKAYCDVMAYNFWGFGKVNILIDLGKDHYGTICDSNNKPVKFNSHIDALNYLSKLGWSVKDTYFVSEPKDKVLHFLLVKEITDDSQIDDGIYVKQKEQKPAYHPGKSGDDLY